MKNEIKLSIKGFVADAEVHTPDMELSVRLIDFDDNKYLITFSSKDIKGAWHHNDGKFWYVFVKTHLFDGEKQFIKAELCSNFIVLAEKHDIRKVYINVDKSKEFRLVDDDMEVSPLMLDYYDKKTNIFDCKRAYSYFTNKIGTTQISKMNQEEYYIDSILEAKKVFVSEMGSVLNTVAKDSKIQVEFKY